MKNLFRCLSAAFCSALACAAHAQTIGQDGWSQFTPSPDTRTIYVSATGDDGNSGTSASSPKRTIAAGAAMLRDGYPDWLLLKSGETWTETFPVWGKGGRSNSEPMRISIYGGLERAVIICGSESGFVALRGGSSPKSHLVLSDLAFSPDAPGSIGGGSGSGDSDVAGVKVMGSWTDVLLENLQVRGFHTNLVFQSDRTVELMQDMRVRRCVVIDACTTGTTNSEGCYIAGVDRLLLEECVFDHNGWSETVPGAIPTMFRHNIYIQGHDGNYDDCTNVTVRGLTSARAAATGMQQRPGGACDNNLFIDNPINVVFGTTGGTVSDCVVVGSHDIDPSLGRGIGFNLVQGGNMTATRCITVGLPSPMGSANVYGYAIDTAVNVRLENCVAWKWKSSGGSGMPVNAANAPYPTVVGGNMEQSAPTHIVSIQDYMASLGGTPTVAAYMDECRLQSRANWRPQYTAAAFNNWTRVAFGLATGGTPTPCYANCDGSTVAPIVNIADFTCFMTRFAASDPWANCDGSTTAPLLNIADFTCFIQKTAAGCP